jgi:hypothetical protein
MRSRGKDILLLVVALVALVVAVYTFRSKPKPAPAAPVQAAPEQAAAQEESATTPEEAEQEPGEEPGPTDRNPFSAPGAAPAVTDRTGVTSEEGPTTPGEAPGEAATALQPGSEPASGGPTAALSLTGIVAGRPAVAIIREDGQRYFVKVGDQVGDRYRVQAIGHQDVVLAGPQGKVILRMGGRQ